MTDIMKQIDKLVADKTFSLDALEGIKALKDEFVSLQALYDESIKAVEKARSSRDEANEKLRLAFIEIEALKAKVAAQEATTAQAQSALYESHKQAAVAAAYKDAMQIVFRPTVVREAIYKNIGGTNGMPMTSENTTVTREEG